MLTKNISIYFLGSEVLEIENITFSDEGYYACVVGNEVANVVAGAYLTVEDPKIVLIEPQSHNYYVIVSYKKTFLRP